MKIFKKIADTYIHLMLSIMGSGGYIGTVQASFDSDFVHKYAELNLGNWGHTNYTFPDSNDRINAFNRSVNINIPIGQIYKVNANFSTHMNLKYGSNIWQWSDINGVVSATPRSNFFNAGIGFNLGFGRMIAPQNNPYGVWVYESESGKISRFYDNFDGEVPVANVFYSHDSSKLRLKVIGSASLTVEFITGEIHEFRSQEGNWEIFKRSDQFGNYQQFTYDYTNNRVTTSDNHGRIQWIHFKADPSGYFPRVIDKIRVTKPVSGVATHTFNYSTMSISTPAEDNSSATPATIMVPILTSVTYPLGEQVLFGYYGNANVGAGRLKNYTNKFGGRVRYVYANIDMPLVQNPNNLDQSLDHFASDVVGVTLRRTVDDVGGGILGDWTFSHSWHTGTRNAAPSLSQPTGMIVTMVRPDGFKENKYFKVPIEDVVVTSPEAHTADKSEYGERGLVNDWTNSVRSAIKSSAGVDQFSRRAKAVYACVNCLDPNPKITKTQRLAKNGYIRRNLYSNINWANKAAKIQQLDNWTVKRTTDLEQATSKPAVSSLWIAKPATKTTTTEGAYSKVLERCVSSPGQITRQRMVRGSIQASNDFIQSYLYDASGNPVETKYYGGDSQVVTNGSLCSLSLPTPQYRKYTNWSKGSISGEGYLTATGAIANETNANIFDAQTGLTISHHSGDGLWQTYDYDQNLRLTSSSLPSGMGGQFIVVYSARSGATYATKTITEKTNDGVMVLAQSIEKYDSFGRVIEAKKLGSAGWAVTSSTYDTMGKMSTATNERGGVTQYLKRDYKGRVGIKRPPEGSIHDVTYTYSGDKVTTRKVSIAKDLTINPPVEEFRTYTNTSDLFGRNVSMVISDQDGAMSTRHTTYDLNGQWVTKSDGTNNFTNLNQYDAYGFLKFDSYGSTHTYNGLGKALEEYNKYGDKIDRVYDAAARLTSKDVSGLNYIYYEYATTNSPGEYNKGKLVSASRNNPIVSDIENNQAIPITVIDTFEYKGRGGKRSKRRTDINLPSGSIVSSESSVVYNDRLQPLTFSSPSCIAGTQSITVYCPTIGGGANVDSAFTYNLGHIVSVMVNGGSFMPSIGYNAAGDVTNYSFENGTSTELYYSASIDEHSQVIVRKDGALVWNSGNATADGGKVIHHYGTEQEIPDDFYSTSTLTTQPTVYPSKYDNNDDEDALGLAVKQNGVPCEGNYGPCYNVNVYDANNNLVWQRNRPYTWPSGGTIGLETPNRLNFTDVLGRSVKLNGYNVYVWDSHHFYAELTTINVYARTDIDVYFGASRKSIGQDGFLNTYRKYFHLDFLNSSVGSSISTGEFTPQESF